MKDTKKKVRESSDSYSNLDESKLSASKTSSDDKITCFECMQKVPKSKAGTHKKVCKKTAVRKSQDEVSASMREKNYSPIRET